MGEEGATSYQRVPVIMYQGVGASRTDGHSDECKGAASSAPLLAAKTFDWSRHCRAHTQALRQLEIHYPNVVSMEY